MFVIEQDDLVFAGQESVDENIRQLLTRKRRGGYLTHFGRGQWTIPTSEFIEQDRSNDPTAMGRFLSAYVAHENYVRQNLAWLIVDAVRRNDNEMRAGAFGIVSKWTLSEVDGIVGLKPEAITRNYGNLFVPWNERTEYWAIQSSRLIGGISIVSQAYAEARRNLLMEVGGTTTVGRDDNILAVHMAERVIYTGTDRHSTVALPWLSRMIRAAEAIDKKISGETVLAVRNQILARQATEARQAEIVRKQLSQENFSKYWSSIKNRIVNVVDTDEVRTSFATVPLQPKGTASSRTWGIEIETVSAYDLDRPPGWERRSDGSLEPLSNDCSCGCEDCENDEHCDYDDCHGNYDDCAEFVSPILNHFNSSGLRDLCSVLEKRSTNTTPGIHVHVGAGDLSVTDVARLIRAYSAVSPFVEAISYREVRGYCKDVTSNNLAYWLGASRNHLKRTSSDRAVEVSTYQPDNRYHDLNLVALQAHGTIEFRVMGPHYNYEHLVRWAWFCREMVNLSKLDLPQSIWTSVRSMADVLAILNQYGSETMPDTWLQDTDELSTEQQSEEVNEDEAEANSDY